MCLLRLRHSPVNKLFGHKITIIAEHIFLFGTKVVTLHRKTRNIK